MPHPGDRLELTVDRLAYGGQGVARHEGFVVFVRGAMPGDTVRATITRRKPRYAVARLDEVISPSPLRHPPLCEHAADCGGCEWQTLDYATQLELKQAQVRESLEHIAGLRDVPEEPILGMEHPWEYRNKMEYSFGEATDGGLVLGLHRRGSWREVVEATHCRLAPPQMETARAAVVQACRDLGLSSYRRAHAPESDASRGILRHLVVRRGLASGDLFVELFVSRRFTEERLLMQRVADSCDFTSFAVTVNATPADAAVGEGPFMLAGPPSFHETLADTQLQVPAHAFLQTNSVMCSQLYEVALRFADPDPQRPAWDLYCGIGSLSIPLARRSGSLVAVEVEEAAVAAARVNATLNETPQVTFHAGDVRRVLKPLLPLPPHQRPAVVVTDPPRAGMSRKAVTRMAALDADRIVYVSCNPTTLAGNAVQLGSEGYRLIRVAPVDMFPQTHHIETVALFERALESTQP